MDNESAVAYSFIFIVLFIFVIALIAAFIIPPVNMISKFMNKDIQAGVISQQTKTTYDWQVGFAVAIPGIGILGLFLFGIVVAIERANAGP
jgi:hypothetical protein